jgi:hypothetical protein
MESVSVNSSIKPIFNLLKLVFTIVPIVAGLDKFTNILTNWEHYLSPQLVNVLPFSPHIFMMIVGVIEIIAGIIVWVKTEMGAYIVAAWLTLIALSLLISFNYLDVAVRDLVMAISAFSLARMTKFIYA